MKNVGAALGRVALNGAALLPFWVLYGISDIIFLLAILCRQISPAPRQVQSRGLFP